MCKPTASKTYPAHKPFTEPESRTAIVGVRITPMTTDLYGRLIGAIEDIRIELEFHNGDLPPDVYSRLHKSNRALRVAVEMCSRNGYTTWDKSMVPLIDGKYEEEAAKKWELAHGHDIRLKCYPEFGCQLLIDPEDLLLAIGKEVGVSE